ncbi:MAG TPA: XrtA system polysaccharide chain length determinant [Terracidiphilus sp.]|jgi:polysaccharide chain length determinant protein (PEP-CTERM system associated)
MPELLEEQEQTQPDFDRYVDVVRRRHVYFLVPVLIGWLAVWSVSWLLPTKYKSSTLILVEQPTMPESYVAPNVNENLQDRLQSISQQILSRTRLLMIIEKLNLYSSGKGPQLPDDKVEAMRKDISVDLVKDSRNGEISAFKVSFSSHDPVMAQKVTNELTQLFINESLRVRQQQSEGTTHFIEQQLEEARVTLADQEAKVKQFEAAHEGALPTQQQSNLQILGGLQGQLQNEQDSLNTAKQQKVYFQSLIEQYRNLHATGKSVDGAPTDLTLIDQQLAKLGAQLSDLRSRYTDSYPDVQRVKAQIVETQKQRDQLLAAPRTGGAKSGASEPVESTPLLQLQSQLQANQLEIASRERSIASLQGRINEYQGRLNAEPGTEQQLADLTRGYEQSKANYDDLMKKKNSSVMATNMEQMQQGERFTMLDPASLPTKPDFPNRMKFCGMGVGVGIALGLLVVVALELLDGRMHGEKEIKEMLGVPVLAEIPEVKSALDEHRQKRQLIAGWALTSAVFLVIAVASAYSYLRG